MIFFFFAIIKILNVAGMIIFNTLMNEIELEIKFCRYLIVF